MMCVAPASIAYIATQVCIILFFEVLDSYESSTLRPPHSQAQFALSLSAVFSRTDIVTNSQRFYDSILNLFKDVEEREEVEDLIDWWNQ